jgi:hypothetical protein
MASQTTNPQVGKAIGIMRMEVRQIMGDRSDRGAGNAGNWDNFGEFTERSPRLPGNWPAMQRAPSGIAEPVPAGCAEQEREQVDPQQGRAAGPGEIARRQDPGPLEAEAHKAPRAPPGLGQSWHPPADGSCSGQMPLDLSDRLLGQVLVDLGDDARAEVGVKHIP